MTMVTTTLFKYVQSELIKDGNNEIVEHDESGYFDPPLNFLWFDDEKQFINKIIRYDEDVEKIVNDLFAGLSLDNEVYDKHFKRTFINRFGIRQINRQTIESFKMELVSTFMIHQDYINRMYEDMDLFITQSGKTEQQNTQLNDGSTITDSRSAFADLPQSHVNLDVDDTNMSSATDNTISRNKQKNNSTTDGETVTDYKSYDLDQLFKSSGVLEQVLNEFDRKCFLQVW